jgi:prepilin-type N-terminal cleavage/methylation domain-containing protein
MSTIIKVPIRLKRITNNVGFTMLEVMLSMTLMAILAAMSSVVYYSLQNKNGLDIAATTIAQSARRAQALAQASDGDIGWGVYVQAGKITLFKGSTFATKTAGFDEVFDMPATITLANNTTNTTIPNYEVDFAKFTGDAVTIPAAVGLKLTSNGQTKAITINAKGMVSL